MLDKYAAAWTFHQNTLRWEHNMLPLSEEISAVASFKEYTGCDTFPLPDFSLPATSFSALIQNRYSCRHFKNTELQLKDVGAILKSGYGIFNKTYLDNLEMYERPVPSGGALYPLEIYLIARHVQNLPAGIYHYSIQDNFLEQIRVIELPRFIVSNLFMHQPYVSDSAAILIITSMVERNMWKYLDRGYRYMLFEAGHVAQNINLAALSLDIGTLNLGGFFDAQIAELLQINIDEEIPLYCVAMGHHPDLPAGKNSLRMPDEHFSAP